jgi:transcriptional regulator with XRE-family HTH domain
MSDGTLNLPALQEFVRIDGRSVRKIAHEIGVSSSYLAKILRGEKAPSLGVALRLAGQLRVKLAAFYTIDPALSSQIDVLEGTEGARAS